MNSSFLADLAVVEHKALIVALSFGVNILAPIVRQGCCATTPFVAAKNNSRINMEAVRRTIAN